MEIKKLSVFQSRLETAISRSGLTAKEIANRAGLTEANMSQYRNGYSKPRGDARISSLAHVLHVSPAWLLGLDNTPVAMPADVVDLFLSLSDDSKDKAVDYMNYLKAKESSK